MADFSALKTSIQNYIKQNGNEEITGNLLQQILLSMVTTLGDSAINDLVTALNAEIANRGNADTTLQGNINSEAAARGNADTELGGRITTLQGVVNGIKANVENGYVYAGIATPSTTPVSGKVFYLALTAGTYTNFGATVVPQGINILKYNGSAWSLDSFLGLDDAPTQGSSNLVKSGGVLDSIIKDGSAFDLSAYNNGTTYADLSAALTALNALPAVYKKGGMSVKFVQTSDNNYVQARCMAQNFTTDVTQWQGVDDEPTAGSKNLIESGGVAKKISELDGKVDDVGYSLNTKEIKWFDFGINTSTGLVDDNNERKHSEKITISFIDYANIYCRNLVCLYNKAGEYLTYIDDYYSFTNRSVLELEPTAYYLVIVLKNKNAGYDIHWKNDISTIKSILPYEKIAQTGILKFTGFFDSSKTRIYQKVMFPKWKIRSIRIQSDSEHLFLVKENDTGVIIDSGNVIVNWSNDVIVNNSDINNKYIGIVVRRTDNTQMSEEENVSIDITGTYYEDIPLKITRAAITPEMFGAIGDGIVDDTVAIQDAINFGSLHKTPILLSAHYLISDTLIVNQCKIEGDGGHTQIINNNDSVYTIKLLSSGAQLYNFSINAKYGVVFGDWATRVMSNTLINIGVNNCSVGFYHPTNGGYNRMIRCSVSLHVEEGKLQCGYVLGAFTKDRGENRSVGVNYVYMDDCTVGSDVRYGKSTYGIYMMQAEYCYINRGDYVGMHRGLVIPNTEGGYITNIMFDSVNFFGCERSLMIVGTDNTDKANISFVNCDFSMNIGIISGNEQPWRLRNISFDNCRYNNNGEVSLDKPFLGIACNNVRNIDIYGDKKGTYKSCVSNSGSSIECSQIIPRRSLEVTGTKKIIYGNAKNLNVINEPVIIKEYGSGEYTKQVKDDGTWEIVLTSDNDTSKYIII